jgi:hypothetical protein
MSYYKKASPVPWIAGAVLLAAFIGMVVYYTGDNEQDPNAPPFARGMPAPAPAPVPQEPPPEEPYEPYEPPPPPKPKLSPAQAEKRLRAATAEWRTFAVRLCKTQKWKSDRAVAFLEKVTWNDRDLEKQHAHGLASIGTMLGVQTRDPVALAEALEGRGTLQTFFERNWSKVDVVAGAGAGAGAKPEKEKVLEDSWKPNRIRWGFPLDTPIDQLDGFKRVGLTTSLQAWRAIAGQFIQGLEILETEKMPKFKAAVGESIQEKEAKMHAAFRVILDMPDASVKEVVEQFLRKNEELKEEFAKSIVDKLAAAVQAAETTEAAG